MKRRKFVYASALASGLPFLAGARPASGLGDGKQRELYELRIYEMKFRGDRGFLERYLTDILRPALTAMGVNHFLLMGEMGLSDPAKLYVLISYPDAEVYMKTLTLYSEPDFQEKAAEYNKIGPERTLYNRFSSHLLLAFTGMPAMLEPPPQAGLLELRTYEGYSEDAVRRKIAMFNEGEIGLFLETGLNPVFFGEMVAGPYRPCLTYMLHFKDLEERDAHWERFLAHPGWKEMNALDAYANTVSHIRRTFLRPLG